ncbi:hypothetical protein EIN_484580 [Entamoeba invadens IP1]|uniref:Uncharacterized protein n=1 Tax=Entamoeba invadens IP1 TaxID=370355 RepID=A0A0A1U4E4_ENTIV|nr:hypothetical protein EIN_484580 [Entamoeba invadens IP1]ELP89126.1 hypothetical protein EIN_484580 [Entamoeba invadens IP1]|eukprot:XP_004255897.1 hypothetical protein EIN_484580 [Entamoeba invadens IP1]
MVHLEMVYLMKIALHLFSMSDITTFLQVNKACLVSVTSLHVNPWFSDRNDITSYVAKFTPTTMNCNSVIIPDKFCTNVQFLRNVKNPIDIETLKRTKVSSISIGIDFIWDKEYFKALTQLEGVNNVEIPLQIAELYVNNFDTTKTAKQLLPKKVVFVLDFCSDNPDKIDEDKLDSIFEKVNKFNTKMVLIRKRKAVLPFTRKHDFDIYVEIIDPSEIEFVKPLTPSKVTFLVNTNIVYNNENNILKMINNSVCNSVEFLITMDVDFLKYEFPHFVGEIEFKQYTMIAKGNYYVSSFYIPKNSFCVILPKNIKNITKITGENVLFSVYKDTQNVLKVTKLVLCENTNFVSKMETENGSKMKMWDTAINKREVFGSVEEVVLQHATNCNVTGFPRLKKVKIHDSNNVKIDLEKCEIVDAAYCNNLSLNFSEITDKRHFIFSNIKKFKINFGKTTNRLVTLEMLKCVDVSIKSENETFNDLKFVECQNLNFKNLISTLNIQLFESNIINGNIYSEHVLLNGIKESQPINFSQTKSISLFEISNFTFCNVFTNVKMLSVTLCHNLVVCNENGFLEEIKAISSDKIIFKGVYKHLKKCSISNDTTIEFSDFKPIRIEKEICDTQIEDFGFKEKVEVKYKYNERNEILKDVEKEEDDSVNLNKMTFSEYLKYQQTKKTKKESEEKPLKEIKEVEKIISKEFVELFNAQNVVLTLCVSNTITNGVNYISRLKITNFEGTLKRVFDTKIGIFEVIGSSLKVLLNDIKTVQILNKITLKCSEVSFNNEFLFTNLFIEDSKITLEQLGLSLNKKNDTVSSIVIKKSVIDNRICTTNAIEFVEIDGGDINTNFLKNCTEKVVLKNINDKETIIIGNNVKQLIVINCQKLRNCVVSPVVNVEITNCENVLISNVKKEKVKIVESLNVDVQEVQLHTESVEHTKTNQNFGAVDSKIAKGYNNTTIFKGDSYLLNLFK